MTHVPERFRYSSNPLAAWYGRKVIVSNRRAIAAEKAGRVAWAKAWRAVCNTSREAFKEQTC